MPGWPSVSRHGALVAPELAGRDADQQHDQRGVEDQVAGLPEVALLGGDRHHAAVLGPGHGLPAAQLRDRAGRHLLGRSGGGERVGRRQPLQPPRHRRRRGQHGGGVCLQPRHDAADQRDEQQQVGRGEPGRGEHVEEPGRVEDLRPARVVGDVLVDLGRVQRALRQQRAGHRGERQQEEQHQRGAHAGQPAPGVAGERERAPVPGADRCRLGGQPVRLGVDRVGADRGLRVGRHSEVPSPVWPTREVSSIVICPQSPVTSSRPSTTSSPPPTYVTTLACRRTTPSVRDQPAGADRDEDERHPEADAVRGGQGRAPAGARRGQGQRLDRAERRADARRPTQPEHDPEQRRPGQPGRREPVDPQLPGDPRQPAEERQPEQDHDDAEDALQQPLVLDEQPAQPAEQHAVRDEHHGEAQHEQHRAQHGPAAHPGSGGDPATGRGDVGGRGGGLGAGQATDVREVSGHQRQDARRQEADQAGHRRDHRRDHERAAGDDPGEAVADSAHVSPASFVTTGSMSCRSRAET